MVECVAGDGHQVSDPPLPTPRPIAIRHKADITPHTRFFFYPALINVPDEQSQASRSFLVKSDSLDLTTIHKASSAIVLLLVLIKVNIEMCGKNPQHTR